jgi:cell division septum initiation protein DivIVA
MDDQMFRTVMRGFDKEEVFAYIKQVEADANQKVAQARADVIEKDKQIADLKQRIQSKDARYERLENEIEVKYRTYIDNYEKIGSLVYESQVKGDKIIAEAQKEAARLTAESRSQYDRTMAEADLAARTRLDAVQGEIDARLAEGKSQYAKVQEDMNEIVDLINEVQKRFMRAYKEIHEVIQRMPASFDDIESDIAGAPDTAEQAAPQKQPYKEAPAATYANKAEDDLDDYDSYDENDFETEGVHFSFGDFVLEDDDYEDESLPESTLTGDMAGDTIDFSKVGMSDLRLDYTGSMPVELAGSNTGNISSVRRKSMTEDAPDYDFGAFADDETDNNPFADEGTFRLPGENI